MALGLCPVVRDGREGAEREKETQRQDPEKRKEGGEVRRGGWGSWRDGVAGLRESQERFQSQ